MRNSNTILASVQAFMDKMQDGDMRELVANLQQCTCLLRVWLEHEHQTDAGTLPRIEAADPRSPQGLPSD